MCSERDVQRGESTRARFDALDLARARHERERRGPAPLCCRAMTLTLGFSPCPNDTYVFHALVHGLVAPDMHWNVRLEDVEALNRAVLEGALDVSKISYHAYLHVRDEYAMLPSGGALGRGVGPLVVTRGPRTDLHGAVIATPGGLTTANLLLALWRPEGAQTVELRYDRIMAAVAAGEADAGLIIHESRFTYHEHGLHRHEDLGAWWERETGRPIPLGGIAIRRELGEDVAMRVARGIRDSLAHARARPGASAAYVARHAQEMSEDVRAKHIELYVNDFSEDVGAEGRAAVAELFRRARSRGLVPDSPAPLFAGAA